MALRLSATTTAIVLLVVAAVAAEAASPWPYTPKPKTVFCKNKYYPKCYHQKYPCPNECPYSCAIDCVTCKPVCECNRAGAVCQDPRFVGADGITFYFHGQKDRDFCILSDTNLHINAHFIGKRSNVVRRDFTWVQSLGIVFDSHRLFVGARKTAAWDDAVDRLDLAFDGIPVFLAEGEGAVWAPADVPGVSVTRTTDANAVRIAVQGSFQITARVVPITKKESHIHKYGIEDDDCFAHLDLGFKFESLSGEVNGVLGQTYAKNYTSKAKMGVLMPVLGGNKEFSSSSIFSTDCSVSRFTGNNNNVQNADEDKIEFASVNCASGIEGRGVVCKR